MVDPYRFIPPPLTEVLTQMKLVDFEFKSLLSTSCVRIRITVNYHQSILYSLQVVLFEHSIKLNDFRCHQSDHPSEMSVASLGDLPSGIEVCHRDQLLIKTKMFMPDRKFSFVKGTVEGYSGLSNS